MTQIPSHLVVQICTTAERLMQEMGLHTQQAMLYSLLSNNINPNIPNAMYVQPLVTGVIQMIPNWQQLATQGGIPPELFRNAVYNCLRVIMQDATNRVMQAQQQQNMMGGMGMGGGMPGMGGMGGIRPGAGMMPGMGGGMIYADASGGQTVDVPQQSTVAPVFETMWKQAKEEAPMNTEVDEGRPIYNLNFRVSPTADFSPFEDTSVALITHREAHDSDRRISMTEFRLHRAESSVTDAFSDLYDCIPHQFERGNWMHLARYNRLIHVPMATPIFIEHVNKMEEAYNKHGWQAALEATKDFTQGTWTIFSDMITERFNQGLARRMRLADISGVIQVDDINDILDMYNKPTIAGSMGEHQNYLTILKQVIQAALRPVIDASLIIRADDPHFGDFVKCEEVKYFREGFSEYDYGTLPEAADRKRFVEEMQSYHTVLRLPSFLLSTNAVPENIQDIVDGDDNEYPVYMAGAQSLLSHLLKNLEFESMDRRSLFLELDYIFAAVKDQGAVYGTLLQIGGTLDNETILIRA